MTISTFASDKLYSCEGLSSVITGWKGVTKPLGLRTETSSSDSREYQPLTVLSATHLKAQERGTHVTSANGSLTVNIVITFVTRSSANDTSRASFSVDNF